MALQTPRVRYEQESKDQLRVPRPIDVFQVQAVAGTVFTARNNADFQIESLVATNVTAVADYITVHLVPAAGSASVANTIVYQRLVPAKTGVTIFDHNNMGILQPGYTLQALCQLNNSVNLWGFGYDYQGAYS